MVEVVPASPRDRRVESDDDDVPGVEVDGGFGVVVVELEKGPGHEGVGVEDVAGGHAGLVVMKLDRFNGGAKCDWGFREGGWGG